MRPGTHEVQHTQRGPTRPASTSRPQSLGGELIWETHLLAGVTKDLQSDPKGGDSGPYEGKPEGELREETWTRE